MSDEGGGLLLQDVLVGARIVAVVEYQDARGQEWTELELSSGFKVSISGVEWIVSTPLPN